jgi:hypothetical protein
MDLLPKRLTLLSFQGSPMSPTYRKGPQTAHQSRREPFRVALFRDLELLTVEAPDGHGDEHS